MQNRAEPVFSHLVVASNHTHQPATAKHMTKIRPFVIAAILTFTFVMLPPIQNRVQAQESSGSAKFSAKDSKEYKRLMDKDPITVKDVDSARKLIDKYPASVELTDLMAHLMDYADPAAKKRIAQLRGQ